MRPARISTMISSIGETSADVLWGAILYPSSAPGPRTTWHAPGRRPAVCSCAGVGTPFPYRELPQTLMSARRVPARQLVAAWRGSAPESAILAVSAANRHPWTVGKRRHTPDCALSAHAGKGSRRVFPGRLSGNMDRLAAVRHSSLRSIDLPTAETFALSCSSAMGQIHRLRELYTGRACVGTFLSLSIPGTKDHINANQ